MRRVLIWLSIAPLTVWSLTGYGQEGDVTGTHSSDIIEEVVTVGENHCGTWPIEHKGQMGCEFAELENENLPMVLELRKRVFCDCLVCNGNQCTTKSWPEEQATENLLCKRLFRTPTRVAKFMPRNARDTPFTASYTYDISTDGDVENVVLISFGGGIKKSELLQLIKDGAARARFEPIIVNDVPYALVGLRGTYVVE
jgi:hypothetical protein